MSPGHERAPRPGNRGATHSDTATTTTVAPLTVTALTVTPLWDTRLVTVACPFCGRKHTHGWAWSSGDESPGLRTSHCAPYRLPGGRRVVPESGSYYIVDGAAS